MINSIEFDPAYETIFAQNGLATFDALFAYSQGQRVNRNERRDVTVLQLPAKGGGAFFMKRFHCPHLKDMLFTFRNFGRPCSQAELEWRNARTLLDNGIETYRPVCWGAETWCGIERRSLFVTQKIEGQSLIEFLFERWGAFGASEKEELVKAMAHFFQKIHRARLSLPDSYLWHLFVMSPIDPQHGYRFAIIDLHRMQIHAAAPRYAAGNLGALLFSLPDEWFDDRLRQLFLDTYLEPSNGLSLDCRDAFLNTLRRRQTLLTARRQKPSLDHLRHLA